MSGISRHLSSLPCRTKKTACCLHVSLAIFSGSGPLVWWLRSSGGRGGGGSQSEPKENVSSQRIVQEGTKLASRGPQCCVPNPGLHSQQGSGAQHVVGVIDGRNSIGRWRWWKLHRNPHWLAMPGLVDPQSCAAPAQGFHFREATLRSWSVPSSKLDLPSWVQRRVGPAADAGPA